MLARKASMFYNIGYIDVWQGIIDVFPLIH